MFVTPVSVVDNKSVKQVFWDIYTLRNKSMNYFHPTGKFQVFEGFGLYFNILLQRFWDMVMVHISHA